MSEGASYPLRPLTTWVPFDGTDSASSLHGEVPER